MNRDSRQNYSRQSGKYVQNHTPGAINSVQPHIPDGHFGEVRVRSGASRSAHHKGYQQFSQYDTSAIRPRRSKLPKIIGIIVGLVLIGAIGYGLVNFLGLNEEKNSNMAQDGVAVTVVVKQGQTAKEIAETLFKEGLIYKRSDFINKVKAKGDSASLQAGTYVFAGGTSVDEIIEALSTGKTSSYALVIPEGSTRAEIANLVATATGGQVSAEAFLNASSDASVWASEFSFLSEVGKTHLEGFLFPKTYFLDLKVTAEDVVRTLLKQFETETASLNYSYPSSKGYNTYQAVIIASIVEKESPTSEMAHIAGVFYNRLITKGDPSYGCLQSDATTAYYVGHDPTSEEVHADNAYSTYSNAGLPPTPICNPGLEALKAACTPTIDSAFFFITYYDQAGDLKVVYSNTYDEHQKAIAQYL